MATRNYATGGTLGVNLGATYSSAGEAPFSPGARVPGSNGGDWIFVVAEADISAYEFVAVRSDASASALTDNVINFTAKRLSTGNVDTAAFVGVAQTNIASANLGWIALSGNNLRGKVNTACEPNVALFTHATGGIVDDATVTAGYLMNVVALTSAASASAVPIHIGGLIVAGQYGGAV